MIATWRGVLPFWETTSLSELITVDTIVEPDLWRSCRHRGARAVALRDPHQLLLRDAVQSFLSNAKSKSLVDSKDFQPTASGRWMSAPWRRSMDIIATAPLEAAQCRAVHLNRTYAQ